MKHIALVAAALAGTIIAPAIAQTSPSAYTSAIRYDVMGRTTGTIAPDPDGAGPLGYAATRTTYDAAGRPTKIETGELAGWQSESVTPASWSGFTMLTTVETSYDAMDRKIQEVTKGSDLVPVSLVQYSYDAAGRLECTAQRMNPAVYGSLPSSACSLGTEGSYGPDRITRSLYDAVGRVTKVQQAYGTALQEDYATYTYSATGKRTSLTDAKGYLAAMTYDGQDRQARWYFPSPTTTGTASTTDYEEYGYDANGNRSSLRKRDGSTLTYSFDALNRNTVKVVPERSGLSSTYTRDVYYGYDYRGLQTFARFDSAATGSEGLTTTYDGFGRIASSSLLMDGSTRTLSYAWDRDGNRTSLTWPDTLQTSYTYDGLDRMVSGETSGGIGGTVFSYNERGLKKCDIAPFWSCRYYDYVGRINTIQHDPLPFGGANFYDARLYYNPANQIVRTDVSPDAYAWTGHYNVDRNYTANGLNQYTAAGAASFSYDANGNLTSDGATNFVYDVENRLVSASGASNAALRYDPLGRLYEMVSGGGTTRFLQDGDELIAEYDGSGNLLRRYMHGTAVDDPVIWYEGNSVTVSSVRRMRTDVRGSITLIAQNDGTVINVNTYDDYGIPGSGNIGRFQYTGQAWLPELGMYYYKARIYSPTLGRFMQTDPIGYDDQINLYAYVGADPVNKTDPDGTQSVSEMLEKTLKVATTAISASRQQTSAKSQPTQGQRTQQGGQVVGGVGEAKGVIAEASGAKGVVQKAAMKGPVGLLKLAAATMQIAGQMQDGKPMGAATANVAGQAGTSAAAGAAAGFGASFYTANPWIIAGATAAGGFGADVSGLSDAGGNKAEALYKDHQSASERRIEATRGMVIPISHGY